MSSTDSKNLRKDSVWKYVIEVAGEQYLRCKFCNQRCTGGVNRLKHHLAETYHGMKPCNKVSEDARLECKEALANFKDQKMKRNELLQEIGMGPTSMHESALSKTIGTLGSGSGSGSVNGSSEPIPRGPMDKFTTSQPRQKRKEVCRKIGRFMYSKGLPFNTMNDPYWFPMIDVVANFGLGFKPPFMHELRTWILKEEVNDLSIIMEDHKKAWKQYGCSIMSDGWTDEKSRCLIHFLVNSPAGTWFMKSIDASDTIKNGELMFKYLDEVVEEIGEENVMQVITDNASNYVNAGMRLMEKMRKLWWTPCATHCIDLMLEDIGKLNVHATTLSRARQVVKFIYGHSWVLSLMRTFTKNHELFRPAITRFATAFLTLQSLYKQKQTLIAMFSSENGVKTRSTVLFDLNFWPHVVFCIKITVPLVSILREVDSEERPAMGYIYELMDSAKEKIAFNCRGVERKYGPIWRKIDARWTPQLHRPLHAAGYYLNPQLRYGDKFSNADEVRKGLFECMDRMLNYQEPMGEFGSRIAIDSRTLRSPTSWWMCFGGSTPELQKFAIRVLSLTCSASGCERNWSTFELIHTKKRNRLERQRLNALVYVRYNTRLRERTLQRKQNVDPILVKEIDLDDEWIAEKEDPLLPLDLCWLQDNELFNVDAIRVVSSNSQETQASSDHMVSSHSYKRKHNEVPSTSGGKGKEKELNLTLIDEDEDEDEDEDLHEMRIHDSGHFPIIDTLDEDDDDLGDEDLS
ncbi:hypothetical protein PVL29_007853 [Vitis rotundifolia]|uniref:BED-type domain-containing protein n=1 Tax=Vitis rotundifolia TaxID=103349 RepID=A0AA39A107_VITRO|nr:hypothetical protein PVL29_007853 [Vitis rotundifolia]